MVNTDILFPNGKISIGSVSKSPHHFIFGSVSTFKYDDVPMLKTFMCGHSHKMTFLHLKVMTEANLPLIQFSKFSFGSVFPTMSGLLLTFMTFMAMVKTFMH